MNSRHGTDNSVIRLTRYYHGKAGLMFTLSDLHTALCHNRWKAGFSGRGPDALALFLSFNQLWKHFLPAELPTCKTCCNILEVYRKENALPCQKQNWPEGHGFSYFQKLCFIFFLIVNELCKTKCYF